MWRQRIEQVLEHTRIRHETELQTWRRRLANGIPYTALVKQVSLSFTRNIIVLALCYTP